MHHSVFVMSFQTHFYQPHSNHFLSNSTHFQYAVSFSQSSFLYTFAFTLLLWVFDKFVLQILFTATVGIYWLTSVNFVTFSRFFADH